MSWRWRQGGWIAGRAPPGQPPARYERERRPGWSGCSSRAERAPPLLLRQRAQDRFRGGRVRSRRRELQIRLELGRGGCERSGRAFVHERHAELIMRFGVVRVRRDRGLELLLRLGDLAAVPENDALIEQRVRVAAGQRAGRRARELGRLLAGFGRL